MLLKRGQVTIWVIVAIALVGGIIVFFALRGEGLPSGTRGDDFAPDQFVRTCVRDALRTEVQTILSQGGFARPRDFVMHNDVQVEYLCKNINYYEPCIAQYPLYMSHLEEELTREIRDEIEGCFLVMEEEARSRSYSVTLGSFVHEVILKPGVVETVVSADVSVSRDENTQTFDSFSVLFSAPVYELGDVAQVIMEQEAQFCYFEYVGYMNLNPEMTIRKKVRSEGTIVYSVTHDPSALTLNTAIRGCAIPAGF